jgi:predicted ABC-type sugar transport system permease subunit
MENNKVTLGFRVRHWFTHHPWLKLIALGLAVIMWFYIRGLIRREY